MKQNQKIERITAKTLIVGIDIAKNKHVARFQNYRGIELGKYHTFNNTKEGFRSLLLKIQTEMAEHGLDDIIVGMEPTGHYWFNLGDYLLSNDIEIALVNPHHVKNSKELDDNSPTKTDIKDAKVIAQLIKDGRYSVPNIPEGVYAEIRTGMNQRERLMGDLNRVKGRIDNWLDRYFPEFCEVFSDWSGKAALGTLQEFPLPSEILDLDELEIAARWKKYVKRAVGIKRAKSLIESAKNSVGIQRGLVLAKTELKLLIEQYKLLNKQLEELMKIIAEWIQKIPEAAYMITVPGVAITTAAGFIAEVGDLSQYKHWRQVQKLAGLNLKEHSSGKHKGQTKITKRGRPRLRSLLYKCAMVLVAKNPEFKALHQYLKTRAKNPLKGKQSLVVICCKLIRVLFTLGKKKLEYDPDKVLGAYRENQINQAA